MKASSGTLPGMQDYQRDFVDFLVEAEALLVGEFTLKSGRVSPIFFNAGRLDHGTHLMRLGRAYASTLIERLGATGFDVVFGPAYKGIPLAVATAIALAEQGVDKPYLADRKEAKTHGAEGSDDDIGRRLLGRRPPEDARLVLVDDVLTTGGTKEDAVELLRRACPAATFPALLVVLDRQETKPDGTDAVSGFTERTGIPVLPVLTLTDTVDHLARRGVLGAADLDRCRAYWAEHGTAEAKAWATAAAS